MIPKELHTEGIENFHNKFSEVDKELDQIIKEHGEDPKNYSPEIKERSLRLSKEYYRLMKLWNKIDNFIEFEINSKIN